MLNEFNSNYISEKAFKELQEILPDEIQTYIVKSNKQTGDADSLLNQEDYEATVTNLMELMKKNNANFVYSLLNFDNAYYSLEYVHCPCESHI